MAPTTRSGLSYTVIGPERPPASPSDRSGLLTDRHPRHVWNLVCTDPHGRPLDTLLEVVDDHLAELLDPGTWQTVAESSGIRPDDTTWASVTVAAAPEPAGAATKTVPDIPADLVRTCAELARASRSAEMHWTVGFDPGQTAEHAARRTLHHTHRDAITYIEAVTTPHGHQVRPGALHMHTSVPFATGSYRLPVGAQHVGAPATLTFGTTSPAGDQAPRLVAPMRWDGTWCVEMWTDAVCYRLEGPFLWDLFGALDTLAEAVRHH